MKILPKNKKSLSFLLFILLSAKQLFYSPFHDYNKEKKEKIMLQEKTLAPDFTLQNEKGEEIHLHDFKGQKVVLYFYPKDNTPGCSKQACAYKENYEALKNLNVQVIGISKDSMSSHQKFIDKYKLPFILLSDPSTEVIQQYDVWHEKTMAGRKYMGVVRSTYLIDEQGVIVSAREKVNPQKDPLIILDLLNSIQM